jgi:hypothetical protein
VGAPPGALVTMPTQLYGSDEEHSTGDYPTLLQALQCWYGIERGIFIARFTDLKKESDLTAVLMDSRACWKEGKERETENRRSSRMSNNRPYPHCH